MSSVMRLTKVLPCLALALLVGALSAVPSQGVEHPPSGGKAVAHRNGKKVSARNVPRAQLFSVGYPGGEPTIGITKKGDLYFPSIDVHQANHVEVLKSRDGGNSWDVVSPTIGGQNSHPASLDPYIYIDKASNRIFNIDLTVACSLLSFSDNEGKSWTTNPLACGRPVNDHQTLFSGPPVMSPTVDFPSILYYCWNDVASTSCTKSLDGGVTFASTGTPAFTGVQPGAQGDEDPLPPFCGGLAGHGVVDKKGTIYLPKESCLQPWLGISHDEGATWTNVKVARISAGNGILDPSVAVDKKGNVYYVWTGGDRRIRMTVSTNGGKKWSDPVIVDAPRVREANIGTVTVGAPGKVAIAYYGSENSPWKYKCAETDCGTMDYSKTTWNGYMAVTTNALAKKPTFMSASVNDRKDPLVRGRCGPGRCQLVFDFIDVEIAPNGTPYATFVDGCYDLCLDKNATASPGNAGLVGRLVGGPKLR